MGSRLKSSYLTSLASSCTEVRIASALATAASGIDSGFDSGIDSSSIRIDPRRPRPNEEGSASVRLPRLVGGLAPSLGAPSPFAGGIIVIRS